MVTVFLTDAAGLSPRAGKGPVRNELDILGVEALDWQGGREHTASIRPTSNVDRRDGSAVKPSN